MLKITKNVTLPRQDVQPLNVAPPRYAEVFQLTPPQHLGILLLLLLPEYTDPDRGWPLGLEMTFAGRPGRALLDYDKFRAEFVPAPVKTVQIFGLAHELPHDMLGLGPVSRKSAGRIGIPSVAFFDADKGVPDIPQIRGLALATRVVERLAITSGSYEPADHGPFSMTAAEAADYHTTVDDLYEDGFGIWCRDLLPLYQALRSGTLAHLEEKAVVEAMRSALATSHQPTELRYQPVTP